MKTQVAPKKEKTAAQTPRTTPTAKELRTYTGGFLLEDDLTQGG
jgi:hypothetical protein